MKKMIVSVASVLVAGSILAGVMLTSATEPKNKGDNTTSAVVETKGTSNAQGSNNADNVSPSEVSKSDNTASTTADTVSNETISLAKAKEKALKDAGIDASDAKFTKAKLDKNDGEYEIEFIAHKNDGDYEYEYDIESSSGNIVKKECESVATANVASSENKMISLESAKGIALKDAGLTVNDCTFIKAELDKDGGEYEYELEFKDSKKKYSYSVNAYTGDITEKEVEEIKQTTQKYEKGEASPSTVPYSNSTEKLTLNDIKKIALSDAKVSESKANFTSVEFDDDDNMYEIEFVSGNKKYEYEIFENGTIIKKEVEKVKDSDLHTSALISIDKARSIALSHAGLKESEIKQKKIEVERDDGIYKYEFEFTYGKYEYEYEINAKTGEIIDYEKEIDD